MQCLAVGMVATETVVGLWLGLMARVFISSLQFAGFLAGQSSALANALRLIWTVGWFYGYVYISYYWCITLQFHQTYTMS